jgi:sulfate adenylyltransferase
MASASTCPDDEEDRLLLSGTLLRKMISEEREISSKFTRPEILVILHTFYDGLTMGTRILEKA